MDASPVSSKPDLSPDISREQLGGLLLEVRDLQRRVAALEHQEPERIGEAARVAVPELHLSSDTVPAIGRALLAIAGAYLLRALTELHVIPLALGVASGILYAGFWLWHATRAKTNLAATLNLLSAGIILIPLVWEATVRLHAISTWTAALVVILFSLAALRNTRIGPWSAAAGSAMALALLTGTRDLLPSTIALLAVAVGAEFENIDTRWFVALCADLAILIVTLLAGRSGGLPEGYAPLAGSAVLAALAVLPVIYVGSAAARTLFRGRSFTSYEVGQTACAFALGMGGVLHLTRAAAPLGIFACLASAACYAIALRARTSTRNIHTYAAFGGLVAISGTWLLFSGLPLAAAWSALAIVLSWTAFAKVQAPALLWLAAVVSGVAAGSASQLFANGSFPFRAASIILIGAAVAYARLLPCRERWAAALIAAVFVWCAAGIAAALGAGAVVLMGLALLLAWSSQRSHKPELIWLMYAVMVIAGVKILFRDFSHESTITLVAPLLAYGATFLLLPRILRPD